MDKEFLDRVMEATRLTRSGRLEEATALLQRGLAARADASDGANPPFAAAEAADVIEGECVEIADTPPGNPTQARPSASTGPAVQPPDLRSFFRKWKDQGATARDAEAGITHPPGNVVGGTYANAAGERTYNLYIPTRYAGQPLPLLMMLHGCKQNPEDFAAGTQMNELADEHGFFVLYPAQSAAANHAGCWNWFRKEDQLRDRGEPSILAGMTRSLMARYAVAESKVFVAGLSAGGAMAAVLGVTYPDLFRGVGIHSGLACGIAHDLPSALAAMKGMPGPAANRSQRAAASAIPTIVFHGDRDRTVHPRNGADVISQSAHHDDGPTEVAIERGQAPDGHAYTKTVHRDASGRIVLEHWLVHGGGHAWFGGSRRGSYTDPRGPKAANEMVRFFLQSV